MKTAMATTILLILLGGSSAWGQQSVAEDLQAAGVTGGLVVHIGCGDGMLTAELRGGDAYLVQGLDVDPKNVERTRAHVRSLGLGGIVSADTFDGRRLPYANNLVNLVVVSDDKCQVPDEEFIRVLRPGGSVVSIDSETGRVLSDAQLSKPWPDDIDEWTHYLHGPDNNSVAEDTVVGPPRHFQWISGPRFSRSHDHLASVTTMVSAKGRLFSVIDEGSIAFAGASPRWRLVAQDAFNGIRLWTREVGPWEYHLRDFRSGPADIARRLVAIGDRVYATLGYGQPVVALDAATGETVRTYAGTEGTQEILHYDDMLLLVLGTPQPDWGAEEAKRIVSQPNYSPPFERYTPPAHKMRVMAVRADSGEPVWKNAEAYLEELMPSTLAADGGRVFCQNQDAVVCLDAADGRLLWKTPRPIHLKRLAWSTPTLVVHEGVVFSADRRAAESEGELLWMPSGGYHEYIRGEDVEGELIAFSAETGERLWNCPAYEGFNSPVDVMISDGLLWTGRYAWGSDAGITVARDPKTGEVRRQRPADQEFWRVGGHARCYRAKATSQFLILGRRGVEFVDVETGDMVANLWVRGICQYGVLPANGLLYVPPHACACSVNDMLKSGFMALAPAQVSGDAQGPEPERERLEPGPAYATRTARPTAQDSPSADWPTYRHDAARSGVASTKVEADVQVAWQTDLGGKLTSPVIADGLLLVAETDKHYVHALDAVTGEIRWTYTAGARIDSPPTVDKGRVLFGSADGHVYCLRLDDGRLIWRFRAAPRDRSIIVNGQLESAWPVPGNVLVLDGVAYFAAGRTSYLDGGMYFYKLDATTGRALHCERLEVDRQKSDAGVASGGNLPDILSSDGKSVFLRSARFDLELVRQKDDVPHLWASVGLLDDSWWHRTYWQVGTSMSSGWGGWAKAGQRVPAGRLLVTDGNRVFGYGRNQYDTPGSHVGVDAEGVWGPIAGQMGRWTFYQLFSRTIDTRSEKQVRQGIEQTAGDTPDWKRRVPVLAQGMVLSGDTLFVAGPADTVTEIPHDPAGADPLAEALQAKVGGVLLAVSAVDGTTLARRELTSPPVFDGMAAADSRLYLSTKKGQVVCLGPER